MFCTRGTANIRTLWKVIYGDEDVKFINCLNFT